MVYLHVADKVEGSLEVEVQPPEKTKNVSFSASFLVPTYSSKMTFTENLMNKK